MTSGKPNNKNPLAVIILAAGEGSRFQIKNSQRVKFLYPIRPDSTNTLLSLLVANLQSSSFAVVVFIGGAYFRELKKYLENEMHLFHENIKMQLLDAQKTWKLGPGYSYSVIDEFFSENMPRIVIPADTLFHHQFFIQVSDSIKKILDPSMPCLFWAELNVENRNSLRIVNFLDADSKRSEVLRNPSIEITRIEPKSQQFLHSMEKSSIQAVLLPVLYIPPKFHQYVMKNLSSSQNTLFKLMTNWMKNHDSYLIKVKNIDWGYWDVDYFHDITFLSKYLLDKEFN
jgi:hypothetical protein